MFIHSEDFETSTGRTKIVTYIHKLEAEIHELKTAIERLEERLRQIEEIEKRQVP
jgi:polyhydroxyalkanoate synthesis regulator phasin